MGSCVMCNGLHMSVTNALLHYLPDIGSCNEEDSGPLPWEPAGHGAIATGSAARCAAFWRAIVRNSVAMTWIEKGYKML